jgi:uncharacterized protein
MKCPVCNGMELKIAERQGIEIDYCPECRGIWLDRGELDKIIERSYGEVLSSVASPSIRDGGDHSQQYRPRHGGDHHYSPGGYQRRKSWLSELFD